jgi:branched-chain amino acid transport system permease protein
LNNQKIPVRKLSILAVAGVILGLFPLVVDSPYVIHLAIMVCIYTILGMTFAMIFNTGLISVGCATYYAIGAYASTLLVVNVGLSFWLALPLAVVITGIIAFGIGSIIIRTGGVPFIFLTLITGLVVVQVTGHIEIFGRWSGISNIPPPDPISIPFHAPIEFVTKAPLYYLSLSLTLVIMLIFYALYESRIGRAWNAIKQAPDLAAAAGINVYRYRLLAFVVASSAGGMAGSFYAHYYQAISPGTFGGWPSIYIQLYPILGGIDFYILGSAAGAIFMIFVPEVFRIADVFEPIVTGALLLCVIIFLPGGILGTLKQFPRLQLAGRLLKIGKRIRAWRAGIGNLRR